MFKVYENTRTLQQVFLILFLKCWLYVLMCNSFTRCHCFVVNILTELVSPASLYMRNMIGLITLEHTRSHRRRSAGYEALLTAAPRRMARASASFTEITRNVGGLLMSNRRNFSFILLTHLDVHISIIVPLLSKWPIPLFRINHDSCLNNNLFMYIIS